MNDINEITVVLGVVGVTIVLLIWNRLPVEVVAVGASLALLAAGVVDIHQALDGFGDPTVVFIASLFVVSTALESTGVTAWVGQRLVSLTDDSPRRLLAYTMLCAAALASIISVNAAVAALLPMVVVSAVRHGQAGSQLLLPMAFAAHAGSQLTLTGSPVNVLVSEAAYEAGTGTFGYFEFAFVGVPLLMGTIVIAVVLGPRLLPRRPPVSLPPGLSAEARSLTRRDSHSRGVGRLELVVPARSDLIGATVFPGMVTDGGDLVVLGVQRNGVGLGVTSAEIAAGDTLVLQSSGHGSDGPGDADGAVRAGREGSATSAPVAPLGRTASMALLVTAAMVVLLVSGRIPPAVAGLLAVGALVLLKVITIPQAYRGISWTTVVLIAGLIPVSTAMQVSGAAGEVAEVLADVVGGRSSLLLLVIFVICVVLGALMGHLATALLVIPVALAASAELGVSPKPVLLAVSVSCAAALLTPSFPVGNRMIRQPGAYRLDDYPRFGLPILVLYGVLVVFYIPLLWSL